MSRIEYMTQTKKNKVLIIGGGPSGMMAAVSASSFGADVTLIEKNETLGKKLLITGGGRCNITNNVSDNRILLSKFKDAGKFLHSPFSEFDVNSTIKFFKENNLPFHEEAGGRLFPITDKSESVLKVFLELFKKNNIKILSKTEIKNLIVDDSNIVGVVTESNTKIFFDKLIIATGGLSHKETGSTGDGFRWLKKVKHTIIEPKPSLVPVKTKEKWTHELSGLAFENASIKIFSNNKCLEKKIGKLLFTHFGLSGPMVLNISKSISEKMKYDSIYLKIDLYPKLDVGALDKLFQEKLMPFQNKMIKNTLPEIIEKSLASAVLNFLKIDTNKETHQLTKDERKSIVNLLKNINLTPTGLLGEDKAIVTSGGVPLTEINTKFMSSLFYPNIYIIGDMLDIDRPSGGFSLQLCWTTGYVAGKYSAIN